MKRNLFRSFSILIVCIVLSITLATTFNYYNDYKEIHEKKLIDILDYFSNLNLDNTEYEEQLNLGRKSFSGIRLTLIDTDGSVLYDTDEEAETMDSHGDRNEVQAAFEEGIGKDIRKSDTIGEDFYYFAKKLPDGRVLRVSEMQDNILLSFKESILPILFILLAGLLLAFFFVSKISDRIVENLKSQFEAISQGQMLEKEYPEIYPIKRIVEDQQEELNQRLDHLNEYRDTMEIIFQNMQNGFLFLDKENNIEMINDRVVLLLDKDHKKEFIGKSIYTLFRGEKIIDILENKNLDRIEKLEQDYQGKKLVITINPVIANQEFLGKIMILRDITEESILESERRKFTSNVTHELKTPLTSINGYAELLKNNMVKEDDISKVGETILNSGNHLLSLVDKILSLSKLEEKKESEKKEIQVKDLIFKIQNVLEVKARQKNINIQSELEDIEYFGVLEVLEEVIYNLMDNGIKYGVENGNLWVKLIGLKDGFNIIVKDNGIGIHPVNLEKIFQRFYMADESRNRADATGIGLAIVKHGVEFMNGEIETESNLDKGSTFKVFIPYID